MSGSASRFCRRTKATPIPIPATAAATGNHDQPAVTIAFNAYTTNRIEARHSAALPRSIRLLDGFRNSGSSRGAANNVSSMTGTPSRNTEPHHQCSTINPPINGAMAIPPRKHVM